MPHFIDDLVAFGALWYMWSKRLRLAKQWGRHFSGSQAQSNKQDYKRKGADGTLGMEEACRLLGVNPNASLEEIQRSYKEKVVKSHPDKVAHLSEELQMKAKEITLQLNKAIDVIRHYKKA